MASVPAGAAQRPPEYVCVGHFCLDAVDPGYNLGGTVTYAGRAATMLGARLGVYTAGNVIQRPLVQAALPGVQLHWIESPQTTTFRNTYAPDGSRTQHILAVAACLPLEAFPAGWSSVAIAHLAPLFGEVPPAMVEVFSPSSLVCITPQGWLRRRSEGGAVVRREWEEYAAALERADVLIFSEEDVSGPEEALRYAHASKLAVITRAARGADLVLDHSVTTIPAIAAREVEPTGAGDVFAAAFLLEYRRTGSPIQACRFATSAAAFAVEAPGFAGLAREPEVRRRLALSTLDR